MIQGRLSCPNLGTHSPPPSSAVLGDAAPTHDSGTISAPSCGSVQSPADTLTSIQRRLEGCPFWLAVLNTKRDFRITQGNMGDRVR
jgi:hypothetical protein